MVTVTVNKAALEKKTKKAQMERQKRHNLGLRPQQNCIEKRHFRPYLIMFRCWIFYFL